MRFKVELEDKLLQIQLLYGVGLALSGESRRSLASRLVDYVAQLYGDHEIGRMSKLSHQDLRIALGRYGITEKKARKVMPDGTD